MVRFLLDIAAAIGAALASLVLFVWALAQFESPRSRGFSVVWRDPSGSGILFAVAALVSGLVIGAVVGLSLRDRWLRVVVIAGVLVSVAWLSGTIAYLGGGRLPWSSAIAAAMLAAGLVIGGVCIRHIRRA